MTPLTFHGYLRVFPGMTAYGLSQNASHITSAYPMGRIGTPEDIAGLVLFLSSRAGAHISGTFVETDGGALNAGRGYREKVPEESGGKAVAKL